LTLRSDTRPDFLPADAHAGFAADAINNEAPENDVKDAVFKMHDDLAAYLGQQAQ
jgi:hypothetical protein